MGKLLNKERRYVSFFEFYNLLQNAEPTATRAELMSLLYRVIDKVASISSCGHVKIDKLTGNLEFLSYEQVRTIQLIIRAYFESCQGDIFPIEQLENEGFSFTGFCWAMTYFDDEIVELLGAESIKKEFYFSSLIDAEAQASNNISESEQLNSTASLGEQLAEKDRQIAQLLAEIAELKKQGSNTLAFLKVTPLLKASADLQHEFYGDVIDKINAGEMNQKDFTREQQKRLAKESMIEVIQERLKSDHGISSSRNTAERIYQVIKLVDFNKANKQE